MNPIASCGVDCGECHEYGRRCDGCRGIKGAVFWVQYIGQNVCPLYACAVADKKLDSCGQCGEVPCSQFYEVKDPAISDEDHRLEVGRRVKRLGR